MAKKNNRNGLAIAIIAIGSISLAGLGIYASNSKASPKPEEKPPVATQQKPIDIEVTPDEERPDVTGLTPKFEGDDLKFDVSRLKPPAGVDPKAWVLDQYLDSLNAVPKDAKILSCTVDSSTKVATVDFNSAIESGYGTTDEMTLVNGVLTIMGQFPDVQAVKFTVEGKSIETLGNIDLTQPQPTLKLPDSKD